MARALAVLLLVVGLWLIVTSPASGDHNVYLPLVPNTPLMQHVIKDQEYVWCVDSRASAYPQFVPQLHDVNNQFTERVGIRHRQVAFNDSTCQVRHVMPDGITCSGWAARIYYANLVVDVEYCWPLGFTDWRSAQGHELGHGLLGLHEQYRDSGGSIQCTGRQDTVMDCGSGVRYPTILDETRGCTIIKTSWCGQAPGQVFPYWDGTYWVFADGWKFLPNMGCGEWYMPDGRQAWGPCADWGGRWNPLIDMWTSPASSYDPTSNTWWAGGLTLP